MRAQERGWRSRDGETLRVAVILACADVIEGKTLSGRDPAWQLADLLGV